MASGRLAEAFETQVMSMLQHLIGLGRWKKRGVALLSDALLSVFAVWLSFSIRLGEWTLVSKPVLSVLTLVLITFPPIFWSAGAYRIIFRFSGLRTISTIAGACVTLGIFTAGIFLVIGVHGVPRTTGILVPILFFLLVSTSRIVARYLFVEVLNQRRDSGPARSMMIYGAGFAGQQLAMSLRHEPNMWLRGFIDDDPKLNGQRIEGIRIYHSSYLAVCVEQMELDTVVLAMPKITRGRAKEIVEALQKFPLQVMTLPPASHMINGGFSIDTVRDVSVEDLLGREPVMPDPELMAHIVRDKTIIVTGAGGSIGSELCRQIMAIGPKRLVLAEMTEYSLYAIDQELGRLVIERTARGESWVDIVPEIVNATDGPAVARMMERHHPQTVFHAAAYKHVPLVEANIITGIGNNIEGMWNVALEAERMGVSHCILISTDKAVRPTNLMGASKRVCELMLQALAARDSQTCFSMVRFGNVLGSSGSVVPLFREQIRRGGPVTLTHRDITRYFMTIPEASQLVIQAGAMAQGGDVFVLDMGKPVRIYDLATSMIRLCGLSVRNPQTGEGDIEIREVGLRPGEKLYEELLVGGKAETTRHPRIMRSNEAFFHWREFIELIALFRDAKNCGDQDAAVGVIKILVPEYVSPTKGTGPLLFPIEKTENLVFSGTSCFKTIPNQDGLSCD